MPGESLGTRNAFLDGTTTVHRGSNGTSNQGYIAPGYDPSNYGGGNSGSSGVSGTNASNTALQKVLNTTPGMTPEQMQVMRNRIADTNRSQQVGSEERLRQQMQRSGLSGTGQETRGLLSNERANMAGLQNALTTTDLANLELQNKNRMQLANMGIQAASNVDQNSYNLANLAQQNQQYMQNFGYQQYLDEVNQRQYEDQKGQYNNWLAQLSNGGSQGQSQVTSRYGLR